MKAYFPTLMGNETLKQHFGARVLGHTMAHAYLIQGDVGTGKKTFAHLLAAAVCCEQKLVDGVPLPCGTCRSCQRMLTDNTPDLTIIERGENATIGIDAIRRAKEDMYLSSTENEKKIYMIYEANKMTAAAQNALLIVLEEPPRDVMIFLLCEDASALLPTVRSRVQTVRMALFDAEMLRTFLSSNGKAQRLLKEGGAKLEELIVAAAGSPGRALQLLEKKEMGSVVARREAAWAVLVAVHNRTRFSVVYEAMSHLSTKRQELVAELGQLILAVRDLILLKRDENAPLSFFGDRTAACERCEILSLRSLFAIYDAVQTAIDQLNKNANIGVVTASLSDELRAAPSK